MIRITLVRVALAVGLTDPPLITGLHDDEGAVLPFFLSADALRTRPPHPPRPSVADACCADRAKASMTRVDRFEHICKRGHESDRTARSPPQDLRALALEDLVNTSDVLE
jgi:hypothetical protein